MKIVPVGEIPSETLSIADKPVVEIFKICKHMELVCDANNGIGLSAVQIGLNWKLFIIRDKIYRYFVDCEYKPITQDKIVSFEGCLSLPGKFYLVNRWKSVKVSGWELVAEKRPILKPFTQEISSVVYQHEIDHHNNILISDVGVEVVPK